MSKENTNTSTKQNIDSLISTIEKAQKKKRKNRLALLSVTALGISAGLIFFAKNGTDAQAQRTSNVEVIYENELPEKAEQPIAMDVEEPIAENREIATVNQTPIEDLTKPISQEEEITDLEEVSLKISGVREAKERLTFTIINFNPNFDYFIQFGKYGKVNGLKGSKFSHRFLDKGNYEVIVYASKRVGESKVKEIHKEYIRILDAIEVANGADEVDFN